MGFRKHATLKCHTCKSRRALGGCKKTHGTSAAEKSGWRFTKMQAGAYAWLCPPCARKFPKQSSGSA